METRRETNAPIVNFNLAPLSKVLTAALILSLHTGCGRQEFVGAGQLINAPAAGYYMAPPKVDILFMQDDTGAGMEAFNDLKAQTPQFLERLESLGWDYRFVSNPISEILPLRQVAVSRYDGNYAQLNANLWKAPFPGALPDMAGLSIAPHLFRASSAYTGFSDISSYRRDLGRVEPGLQTASQFLTQSGISDFLRPDAILLVLYTSYGEDTSGVQFESRGDGYSQPTAASLESSFQVYLNQMHRLKPTTSLVQVHALVSPRARTDCGNGAAYAGSRYIRMANSFAGATMDICSTPVSQALDRIQGKLAVTKHAYRTRNLVLASEPDVATLKITVTREGSSQPEILSANSSSGFVYRGRGTAPQFDRPVAMHTLTGYIVELSDDKALVGNDKVKVEYSPLGVRNSR